MSTFLQRCTRDLKKSDTKKTCRGNEKHKIFRIVAKFLLVSAEVQQKLKGVYHYQGHEGALQEPYQHVAPVVFII